MNSITLDSTKAHKIGINEAYVKQQDFCGRIALLKVGSQNHILSLAIDDMFYLSDTKSNLELDKTKLSDIIDECELKLSYDSPESYMLSIRNVKKNKFTQYKLIFTTLPKVWENLNGLEGRLKETKKIVKRQNKKMTRIENEFLKTSNEINELKDLFAKTNTANQLNSLEMKFKELENKMNSI